jgi:NAD(P)H-hydrate epimerase
MRDVDRVAMDLRLTLTRMMENAGANLAWLASEMIGGEVSGRRITVLAGPGGNGGGGLVAARRPIGWGADVAVRLASDPAEARRAGAHAAAPRARGRPRPRSEV